MASSQNINVAVEQVIHQSLRDVLQRISDQHGIQLTQLSIDWLDVSEVCGPKFMIRELQASTFSRSK